MNGGRRIGALLREQGGYATLVSTAIIVVLISLGLVVIAAAGQVTASHQLRNSAELAAVAGAHAHYRGEDACAVAGETVALNTGEMKNCHTQGGDVIIEVRLRGQGAVARAGPL
ncbi:hypothetical protein COCCU_01630 [Corynebacterium occultum]|uniref:Putative Flp pilus-assembly TadG-like N-terminal domain-containing protein n=1 Tax=Corynebacterium occultum TaxID=2675219 RepID=A0A6B8W5V3_9CORY|nr:Rv3654c family TadE-like protein [Corynebacterium occultum]QGU06286.1 hypothetical protein COCCU_01630 [Corynebacterium occultum]